MGEMPSNARLPQYLKMHAWLGFGLAYPADLRTRDLTG
jgi:hypothetical protein